MKMLLAASLALALSGGAAFAQLGYWTNGNASIYGGVYVPQWHDRSNAGELYTPPARQYVQPSTSCTSQQIGNTVFTNCN